MTITLEDVIIPNKDGKKLIVFIDDLDRCEPKIVLDLLSALKLFFTYGTKTIFLCALDKEAVNKAVRVKYSDVIKSDEYLEKVFDISFNMPNPIVSDTLLFGYFDDKYYGTDRSDFLKNIRYVSTFFHLIGFTNPRHIKKVLNKYLIIQYIKLKELYGHGLIPEIIIANGGKRICVVLVLYMIILFEFHLKYFYQLENYDMKLNTYADNFYTYAKQSQKDEYRNYTLKVAEEAIDSILRLKNHESITFAEFIRSYEGNKDAQWSTFNKLLSLFLPYNNRPMIIPVQESLQNTFINQFEYDDNRLLLHFVKYLISYKNDLFEYKSEYQIWDLFRMCRLLL